MWYRLERIMGCGWEQMKELEQINGVNLLGHLGMEKEKQDT